MNLSKLVSSLTLVALATVALAGATSTEAEARENSWGVCPIVSEYYVGYDYGWYTTQLWLSPDDSYELADLVDSATSTTEICEFIQDNVIGADAKSCSYWSPIIENLNTNNFGDRDSARDDKGNILNLWGSTINYAGASANACF